MEIPEPVPAAPGPPQLLSVESVLTAVVRGTVRADELRPFFDASFRVLGRIAAEQRVPLAGPAFALFHGPVGDTVDLEVGLPVERAIQPAGDVVASRLPGGLVARSTHRGAFDGLGDSWSRLSAWLHRRGLSPAPERWESYVTQPSPHMDPRDLRTELSWPVNR